MSKRCDFYHPETVDIYVQLLVEKLRPLVAAQVEAKNAVRDKLHTLNVRIEELKERQQVLVEEIAGLREQGAERVMAGKSNQAVSVKIASRETEQKENQSWLEDLEPKTEALAQELALENQALLETLRGLISPFHVGAEVQMNEFLLAASRLRHSWCRAVGKAINEVGDDPGLAGGVNALNLAYRLKVDRKKSAFVSPGR